MTTICGASKRWIRPLGGSVPTRPQPPSDPQRRRPEINEPTPQSSLRAQRSNPGAASRGPWIASSQELLAMTGETSPSSRFGNYWASPEENGTSPALLLAGCRAAVDRQHRTLTICRFVGSKVQATVGHFLCCTGALHGAESVGHHRIVEQAQNRFYHRSLDESRGYAVGADAVVAIGDRNRAGQVDRRALRGGVSMRHGKPLKPGNTGDGHDRAAPLLLHLGNDEPTHVKHRVQVYRHDFSPFFRRGVVDRTHGAGALLQPAVADAGAIHENVDPTEAGQGIGHRLFRTLRLREIGGHDFPFARDRLHHGERLVEIGLSAADTDDFRAFDGEQLHAGSADACARACDERNLTLQPVHLFLPRQTYLHLRSWTIGLRRPIVG